MSEHFFGVSRAKIDRKTAKRMASIAKRHGADLVETTLPGEGYRRWFACPNRGEPFNGRTSKAVFDDLAAAGIDPGGAGRDRLGDSARTSVLTLKVSDVERRAWEQRATGDGVSLSEWIRQRCNA